MRTPSPKIRRKLLALLSGLVLFLTFSANVSAVTYTQCLNEPGTPPSHSPTWLVYRDTASYYAVIGDVVIRQLHGCTGASGQEDPTVLVFPANLAAQSQLIQVGYGIGAAGGANMQFYASDREDNSGSVWPMTIGFQPVIGHSVRFEILRQLIGGIYHWELYAKDLTTGSAGYRNLNQINDHAGYIWYGIEAHNHASQFGGNSSANIVQLRGMGYRLSNGGAWNFLTGTIKSAWANADGYPAPGCWIASITTFAGPYDPAQTSLNGYTANNGLSPIC